MSDSGSCRLRKDPDMNGIEKHKPNKIFRPDKPIHKPSESLLTEFNGFPGYVIWATFLLSAAIISIFLENLRNGGRINVQQWHKYFSGSQTGGHESSVTYALLYSGVPAIISLLLEKGLAENKIPQKIGMIAHILNISQLLCLPGVLIYYNSSTLSTVGSSFICMIYFIQVLKLWSYVHVNYWCRVARVSSDPDLNNIKDLNLSQTNTDKGSLVEYPDNLVFKDMAYYFFAPTVCYELNFPRTNGIRKRFVIRCLLEAIIITILECCLHDWMFESMKTTIITHLNTNDLLKTIEFHLKIYVPIYINSIGLFYIVFQSHLNMLAELMYFADRRFYLDWWNASNTRTFWKKWDVPIHRWFLRHIYLPLRDMGFSRKVGLWAAFLISGLFHEYLISAPLKISAILVVIVFVSQAWNQLKKYFPAVQEFLFCIHDFGSSHELSPHEGTVIVTLEVFTATLLLKDSLQAPVMDFSVWIEKHCGSKFCSFLVPLLFTVPLYILFISYYYKYLITHFGQSAFDSHHNLTLY